MSCNCHANWTSLGQLSKSVNGAFQLFGSPVVSVSKIKYILVNKFKKRFVIKFKLLYNS